MLGIVGCIVGVPDYTMHLFRFRLLRQLVVLRSFVDKQMQYSQFYGRNGTRRSDNDIFRHCAILRIDSMPLISLHGAEA